MEGYIKIKGAREHNLKNINVNIPRNQLVVITGPSGSGKSSLAFDTIYAEGQRRYIESLSSYARQFLEQMQKPDVDSIEGLSPTIAIEQRKSSHNPRSTVATITEVYDYLRLLFARVGDVFCYKCGRPIQQQTLQQIVDNILRYPSGTKLIILGPVVRGKKGNHEEILKFIRREGFTKVRIDGHIFDITELPKLNKNKRHNIEVVIDRIKIKDNILTRLTSSVELALKVGEGIMLVNVMTEEKAEDHLYSQLYACVHCNVSFEKLEPRMFSFNSPYGACKQCGGLGTKLELDVDLIVPDKTKSLRQGAIEAFKGEGKRMNIYYYQMLYEFCEYYDVDMDTPFCEIPQEKRNILLYGDENFEGVIPNLWRRFNTTESEYVKRKIHKYMSELPCPACNGQKLRPESLGVKVGDKNIVEITKMSIDEALSFFNNLKLEGEKALIGYPIIKEIIQRLQFMQDVGVGYLTLDRSAESLSGGESQRIKLATQLGSSLAGVIYVLDEPTIGLHKRDNIKLIETLKKLKSLGNTVIIVEHDETVIKNSDYIIDMGPGAGSRGGYVVARGSVEDIMKNSTSLTGKYLSGKRKIDLEGTRISSIEDKEEMLIIKGAKEHNLKNIDVKIPLRMLVCITGVSGSGKSTLINEILVKALMRKLYNAKVKPGKHTSIVGIEYIDKVINIDQSPIGKSSRSNPATYVGLFDEIRKLFASLPESKIRGYKPGRFSFNIKGGRCEACEGLGVKKIEMHFLPDVYIECEECKGKRFNRDTLQIKYNGLNIADVLDLEVEKAYHVFRNFTTIRNKLELLMDVGLGYLKLGQSSTTLSGGESQRIKLASELGKKSTGNTLYVLDEPTTGLHFSDVERLLRILKRLVKRGNTVIVIEHNMDIIKHADYIIDLGPEGGENGGRVVCEGPPSEIIKNPNSYTARYLKEVLET